MQLDTRVNRFEEVALPHLDELYRQAVRWLHDPVEAQDVVQQTYLEAWKSFDRFELGTNCRAWLFRILFHTLQHHRRRWNYRVLRTGQQLLDQTHSHYPGIIEGITYDEILQSFERIPSRYRQVLLMAIVDERSYKEIAGILRIPIGTVMSRLNRGRKLLRRELGSGRALGSVGAKTPAFCEVTPPQERTRRLLAEGDEPSWSAA
ncbi:MAG: sigma-70 family RNA polymerase sigma factor [Acidobacteriota bacterium]